ncbi:tryptophan synthase alpha chain [Scopulibacillus daqui]|uniref:Tryptophan synthase alpha chain n=1 Tax=Scopulibacillus daqui TaxID=1469162 RepID=A0ABS2PZ09_9BACL|nr:tryptophan synthase subunit alpha [Scopulibacillus daqui]MBM7645284.1 tryptophan synthase alpha chain [Scopulibacillus daqui]
MSRFSRYISKDNKMLFIPYITAGDPNADATVDLALMLESLGAHAIELGIPYSDPLADGPVIQKASIRALNSGMTLERAMSLVPIMREKGLKIPVIIFTYYNLLLQLGEEQFFKLAKNGDIDAVLVPDLPFEESCLLREKAKVHQIPLISLVAPTTSVERLKKIGEASEGFLYCVSSLGVTGVRDEFHPDVYHFLKNVKSACDLPIAVGFGISSYQQVEKLSPFCDGFIVGSVIVREVENRIDQLAKDDQRPLAVEEIKRTLSVKLFGPFEAPNQNKGTESTAYS